MGVAGGCDGWLILLGYQRGSGASMGREREQGAQLANPQLPAVHRGPDCGACSLHASEVGGPLGYANFVHGTQACVIHRVFSGPNTIPQAPIKIDERPICTHRSLNLPAFPRCEGVQ